uniref:Uncharacterized protein n=1 Tax=Hyaloperonospora arabidopsidis (strain Emoy2) TaxID=559515 RepID=M4BHT4_HYAAE
MTQLDRDYNVLKCAQTHHWTKSIWLGTTVHKQPVLDLNGGRHGLGEFSSWDRAHDQRTCRRVVGRPRRVGTSSVCRVIRFIVDVPCTRISCGLLLSRVARCAASRSARSEEKSSPFFTLAPLWRASRPRQGASFLAPRKVSSLSVVAAGCRLGTLVLLVTGCYVLFPVQSASITHGENPIDPTFAQQLQSHSRMHTREQLFNGVTQIVVITRYTGVVYT